VDDPFLCAEHGQKDEQGDQQRGEFAEIAVTPDSLHQLPVIAIANADPLGPAHQDDTDGKDHAEQDKKGDVACGNAEFAALADFHQGLHKNLSLPWFQPTGFNQT
jgi:hypothetical protein